MHFNWAVDLLENFIIIVDKWISVWLHTNAISTTYYYLK